MDRDLMLVGERLRPEPIALSAGNFTAEFEPDSGWLRYLRINGREVVRAIYVTARHDNWGTPKTSIFNLDVEVGEDAFLITFDATTEPEQPFQWRGTIEGDDFGVSYRMSGMGTGDFHTNRTGICVLHPASMKGEPVMVGHLDGTEEASTFPRNVAPHEPFSSIQSLAYPGCKISFDGEVFETEDQRNWTDASYKTYSRLQSMPKPYQVANGERLNQEVRIEFAALNPLPAIAPPFAKPLPSIGILDAGVGHSAGRDGDAMVVRDLRMEAFSPSNLTEINRDRPTNAEHVMFGMNPQVHAFDWKTIIESLEVLGDCVRTAKEFGRNVHVGPISLNGGDNDLRLETLLGIGWALGVVAMLTEADAATITFSPRAAEYPVRQVIDDLVGQIGEPVAVIHDAHPLQWIRLDFEQMTLVANLTTGDLGLDGMPAGQMRVLDETANPRWESFNGGSVKLKAYAYARIDRK